MDVTVDTELRALCQRILSLGHSLDEWRERESDDMFQTEHFCGGFDATEDAFCFSLYPVAGGELWFQITAAQLAGIASGHLTVISARAPEQKRSS